MSEEKGLKKLPRKLRIALLVVLILAAVAGAVYGVLVYIRSGSSVVNVYSVEYFTASYSSIGQSETQGPVTADRIQSVMVSSTQIVKEIFVSEGDTVKEGDPLLSYDTTLSDVELERQKIKVGQLELELREAQQKLKEINTYRVGSPVYVTPDTPALTPDSRVDLISRAGCGTEASPYVFIWSGNKATDYDFIQNATEWKILTDAPEGEPSNTIYAVFETREGNSMDGHVLSNYMVIFTKTEGSFSFKITTPTGDYTPCNPQEQPVPVDNTHYVSTLAELNELKDEAKKKISTLTMDLKKAQLKYSTLEYELTNGVIYSKFDGVVKAVNDPEEVSGTSDPAVIVSGGGGYFVTGVLSENELSTMHIGDVINVLSWESYQSGEATITSISEYPADNKNNSYYHYSEGNNNSSLYPFTAAISEDMKVHEGEFLMITYSPKSSEERGLFIDNMFVRKENGQSFVYVEGSDGKLERRVVKTGGSLWGNYTEIISGITSEDFIAFPYGRNVKEGSKTRRASSEMLYLS